jgi:CRP-like cAMP-binding protein
VAKYVELLEKTKMYVHTVRRTRRISVAKDLLKNCYLFRDMNGDELNKVDSALNIEIFNRGDEVFSQGDPAKALYIIKMGSVRVMQKATSGDLIEIAVLGSGSHFGEMAFLDNEKRSAGIEVLEKTEVLRIDYEKLKTILQQNSPIAVKFFRALSLFLCGRLRVTTNDLSFSRELNLKHF